MFECSISQWIPHENSQWYTAHIVTIDKIFRIRVVNVDFVKVYFPFIFA